LRNSDQHFAVGFQLSWLSKALVLATVLTAAWPAAATEVKIWPLLHYRNDLERSLTRLRLFGPLFEHESSPSESLTVLRPLFFFRRAAQKSKNEFSVLYPLSMARWDPESSHTRILGLFSIERRVGEPRKDEAGERRVTLFPFIFYRASTVEGRSLSVLPFYVDLKDFLGYRRIHMILFPGYLHLEEPLAEQTWAPFPFVSWVGGPVRRGWRIWPLYGWHEEGEQERFRYLLWPFFIDHEIHPGKEGRERRQVIGPYWRVDSPRTRSRSYLGPFLTHTIDPQNATESWSFPWPLWLYQSRLETGEIVSLRIFPFFQDRRQGDLHSRFYLWPLYRTRRIESESSSWARRDFLLVIGRNLEEKQFAPRHERSLFTLLPVWRDASADGHRSFSAAALFDALVPRNEQIRLLHAPLWQIYTSEADEEQPLRWSVLWDFVSSDGERIRYPLYVDLSEP
jgi:hypothetical protein